MNTTAPQAVIAGRMMDGLSNSGVMLARLTTGRGKSTRSPKDRSAPPAPMTIGVV